MLISPNIHTNIKEMSTIFCRATRDYVMDFEAANVLLGHNYSHSTKTQIHEPSMPLYCAKIAAMHYLFLYGIHLFILY